VLFLLVHVMGRRKVLQMGAGMPQIGKRVQVCRMPSRLVGKAKESADSDNKYE
jgi:hypothetical protein